MTEEMSNAKLLSEAFKALDTRMHKENKFQSAINEFMAVCTDHKDIDFTKHSPLIIKTAAKYIAYGFERDLAFKYAKEFGLDGLYMIYQLQQDFNINLHYKM